MGNYWSSTETQERGRRYGWKRDLPDRRDYYHSFTRTSAPPAEVDLRDQCPPIVDQGKLGSCTANAIGGAFHFDELKQCEPDAFAPSRLFIYWNERDAEGTVDADSGAEIRDGIKSIARQGVCPETAWPYDITQFKVKPSEKCYADAVKHKAVLYKRVQQEEEQLKACLDAGLPFVFGFTVYESLETEEVAKSGVVPMPAEGEKVLGGHAVMCVGYRDSSRQFIVRNSWGPEWGMDGYCLFPYDYLLDPQLSSDFWTVQRVSDDDHDQH